MPPTLPASLPLPVASLAAGFGDVTNSYSGEVIGAAASLDHFLPRRFVAHDLLWNLAPASSLYGVAPRI